jgi:hypothetical protein
VAFGTASEVAMGITVVLEDSAGAPLATVEDPTNALHRMLPQRDKGRGSRLLGYVDWYGDTTFNYLQADDLLREWHELGPLVQEADARRVFEGVRELAERLRSERHLYLKFYGD